MRDGPDILIVGSGMGGATLAAALAPTIAAQALCVADHIKGKELAA